MLPLKKILCPTDFSEPSCEAIKEASELALHFASELILIHVVTPIPIIPVSPGSTVINLPSYQQELEVYAKNMLRDLVEEKVPKKVQARTEVILGDPANEIVRMADDEKVDVIVIATHGLSGWRRLVFGSVAEKVIRVAHCPVLSIRIPSQEKKEEGEKEG